MKPNEILDLSQLIRRAYTCAMEPVCQRLGVTRMEMDVLLFLTNNPECDTASDLVSLRGLTKSHVSNAVNALVERGMLGRTYRDGNRKTAHLTPLPPAKEIVGEGLAVQQSLLSAAVAGFSESELEAFNRDLTRVMENLRKFLR